MQSDTFEIAFNKEQVEYYQYVREIVQNNELSYWIGNPSVEIVNGTLYLLPLPTLPPNLYLQNYEDFITVLRKQLISPSLQSSQSSISLQAFIDKQEKEKQKQKQEKGSKRLKTLALMGIPNSKTPIEIYQSLMRFEPKIIQTKVIKTTHSKYYTMLLLFGDEVASTFFFNEAFGEQYNSVEKQRIIIRQLSELTLSVTGMSKTEPDMKIFPLRKLPNEGQKINAEEIFNKNKNSFCNLNKNLVRKSSNKEDKNICVICFEQNEETMISILCGHYFHWQCLMRWKEDICPLCRYHQHPPIIKFCQQCNQCDGLWVCLICGARLCCGFDNNILGSDSHIYQHYQQKNHSLSMQLQTKFLFDARQPAFLHQMFYKDLKLYGYEEKGCKQKDNKFRDKISQYQQNISQQMQKQRMFFEESLNKEMKSNRDVLSTKKTKISELVSEIEEIEEKSKENECKKEQLMKESQQLEKEFTVIKNVQSFLHEKVDKVKQFMDSEQKKEKNQIQELKRKIEEKKQELNDYRKNIKLSNRIKKNLGKEKVDSELILGMDIAKKKKKKKN